MPTPNALFHTIYGRNLVGELRHFVHRPYLVVTMEDLWPRFGPAFDAAGPGSPLAGVHLVRTLEAAELKAASPGWPSWDLSARQLCDLELLLSGAFSPLSGYLGREDYESVCDAMRLADGTLWPMPVTLDLPEDRADGLERGCPLALRDPEGVMLAVLHLEEVWKPDPQAEAERVYGTRNPAHPGVSGFRVP